MGAALVSARGICRAGACAASCSRPSTDPAVLVVVQLLDGITAASLGVMVPLMIADISRGTGHFSFAQGIVGTAVGIGASISPTLAGYLSDQFGSQVAFLGLAGIAAVGLAAGGDDPARNQAGWNRRVPARRTP